MNLAIIGSRSFNNYNQLKNFIIETLDIKSISKIISGGASGADHLAEIFANEFKINIDIFYPEWNKYGRKAGLIRNDIIIKNSDMVLAFWDKKSRGTKYTIDKALKNKTSVIIRYI